MTRTRENKKITMTEIIEYYRAKGYTLNEIANKVGLNSASAVKYYIKKPKKTVFGYLFKKR